MKVIQIRFCFLMLEALGYEAKSPIFESTASNVRISSLQNNEMTMVIAGKVFIHLTCDFQTTTVVWYYPCSKHSESGRGEG